MTKPIRHLPKLSIHTLLTAAVLTFTPPTLAEEGFLLDGERIAQAIAESNRAQGLIVDQGMSLLGVRYRFGGTSPETGLDCSGLVRNVFKTTIGLELPRTTGDIARVGDKIERAELQPGDLVFFNTRRRPFSHVGLYVGDGQFLHAPSSGGEVRVEDMNKQYWRTRFNGARRLLAMNEFE